MSAELDELTQYFESIAVLPVRPPRGAPKQRVPSGVEVIEWPLFGAEIARRAVSAWAAAPARSFEAIASVLSSRNRTAWKNALVVPKALALAHWLRERNVDHVHAYWMSTPATVAMVAGRASGIAWSATAHRWDIYDGNAFDAKQRTVSFVRAISSRGAADLKDRMPAIDDRIVSLRLGTRVPIDAVPPTRAGAPFHIVCPAALVAVKGHDVLLEAISILSRRNVPVRCTFCGEGPLRSQLQAEVLSRGLGGVVNFAGFVAQEQLHRWYREGRFSAVVLASREIGNTMMEGVPAALIEAMAFGVPVVAADSGSIGELVDDRCGRLVRSGDATALADAIEDVYRDPDAAIARSRFARERVVEEYELGRQVGRLAALFNERSRL